MGIPECAYYVRADNSSADNALWKGPPYTPFSEAARSELLREASASLRSPVVAVHRDDMIGDTVKELGSLTAMAMMGSQNEGPGSSVYLL